MDNLSRTELSTILDGLQLVRDERRKQLFAGGAVESLFDDQDYRNIVSLQEKIMYHCEKMPY